MPLQSVGGGLQAGQCGAGWLIGSSSSGSRRFAIQAHVWPELRSDPLVSAGIRPVTASLRSPYLRAETWEGTAA
jgi:hypothetical protein